MSGSLYLIPAPLGDSPVEAIIPSEAIEKIKTLSCFIVENERSARRYLIKLGSCIPVDQMEFMILDKTTSQEESETYVKPLEENRDIGIITEAGVPGVADPGATIVMLAHRKGIRVVPLVGPSSILLALMGSGLNGQNFAFNGYLPIPSKERISRIKLLETKSLRDSQSQIFMETPYRNQKLVTDLINHCRPETYLCLATDLTLSSEFIKTRKIREWKKEVPNITKRPTIFILQG